MTNDQREMSNVKVQMTNEKNQCQMTNNW